MNNNDLKYFINISLLGAGIWALYEVSTSILYEISKLRKKIKFLKSKSHQDKINFNDLQNNDYIIIEGKVKKIFQRHGDYIDKQVVVSIGNSTYLEDFYLDGTNVIIQPYLGTRMHNLQQQFLTSSKTFWDRLAKKLFYTKSQVIKESNNLSIFGKINKNLNYISDEFSDHIHIKAKEISGESLSKLEYYIKEKNLTRLVFQSLLLVAIGISVACHIKFYIWPTFKKMFLITKKRTRIYCKDCNTHPCNVLCEKCSNLSEYCDKCYSNLQRKIDEDQIHLNDIKCLFCKKTLDCCQRLLISN